MAQLIIGIGNKCIDVQGASPQNGMPIQLWEKHGGDNQKWTLSPEGYIESSLDTTKCLDIQGGNSNNGTPIQLWEKNGGAHQKWTLTPEGYIESRLDSTKCLDVQGRNTNNGAPIQLWEKNGGINQRWRFENFYISEVRVVAWNIQKGTADGARDQMSCLNAIKDSLIYWSPDIALLNEVVIWNFWTNGGINQVEWLAKQAGYNHYLWAKSATWFMRGVINVAVLSRYPLLPKARIEHSAYLDGGGYATLHVIAEIFNHKHHVFSTRFTAWDVAENLRSHETIQDIIAAIPGDEAVIFGGDLNTGAGGVTNWPPSKSRTIEYNEFANKTQLRHVLGGVGWTNDSTPADHILFRGDYEIPFATRMDPINPNPSDHPWVIADLTLRPSENDIVKEVSNPAIYVIYGGAKFHIPSPAVFSELGFDSSKIRVVPDGVMARVSVVPRDGTVLRELSSAPVYVIQNGQKCWISTPIVLERFGGWSVVKVVPYGGLDLIPMGPKVDNTAGPVGSYCKTIKVKHSATSKTLHSHAFNYGHSGSSRQQQVTAFEGYDDNDLWLIKGPHGQAEDFRAGQPVQDGDIIRLEHRLTRRNLHSHGGIPSPVTRQQEVTCFGGFGIGDSGDNWRIEIEGGGIWTLANRFRFIHVGTNHALHSHEGFSHPQWTRGQQEVTGFSGRDENDWWILHEVR